MKLISIVAPMYNESSIVNAYCRSTRQALDALANRYEYEIILVNDGSSDETLTKMLEEQKDDAKHIAVVSLTRNFGLEGAVQAGLHYAKGDAVVVMDADLQDPPSLICEMVKEWEKGAEVVHAVRTTRKNDTVFKRSSAKFYYKLLSGMAGKIKIIQGAANYKLLSRRAIETMEALPEKNRVFRVTASYIGLKTAIVGYDRDKRYAGKTKYDLRSMIPYALDSITGVSVEPLRKIRFSVYLSLAILIFSLVFSIVIRSDLWRAVSFLSLLLSFFAVMLFVCIAIIAEYIAQIFIEAKGRPISMVECYSPSEKGG